MAALEHGGESRSNHPCDTCGALFRKGRQDDADGGYYCDSCWDEYTAENLRVPAAPPPPPFTEECRTAWCRNVKTTPCAGCSRVAYCSDICRDKDWKARHSIECDTWASVTVKSKLGEEKAVETNDPPNASMQQAGNESPFVYSKWGSLPSDASEITLPTTDQHMIMQTMDKTNLTLPQNYDSQSSPWAGAWDAAAGRAILPSLGSADAGATPILPQALRNETPGITKQQDLPSIDGVLPTSTRDLHPRSTRAPPGLDGGAQAGVHFIAQTTTENELPLEPSEVLPHPALQPAKYETLQRYEDKVDLLDSDIWGSSSVYIQPAKAADSSGLGTGNHRFEGLSSDSIPASVAVRAPIVDLGLRETTDKRRAQSPTDHNLDPAVKNFLLEIGLESYV